MRNERTPIAVEGFPFIGAAAVATALLVMGAGRLPLLTPLAVLAGVVTLFIAFFFRNPQRRTPTDENAVIAPADGRVIFTGSAFEPHLGAEAVKVSIFMSVFNVHVNRSPVTGAVVDTFYTRGKFLDVRHERATFENEQSGLLIETERGARLVVVQVAGLIARRIVCYIKKGDRTRRGERYGLIRFGSRLDVYLPAGTTLAVAVGDATAAGETVLGYLP